MKPIKYKYIGIRGHRGSGKNTISFLLANTIQFLINNKIDDLTLIEDNKLFNVLWRIWCDKIIENEQGALDEMNTNNVYLDSFGYNPKFLIELLTDIPHEYFNSDYYKDHVIINIYDFSWEVVDDPENHIHNKDADDALQQAR